MKRRAVLVLVFFYIFVFIFTSCKQGDENSQSSEDTSFIDESSDAVSSAITETSDGSETDSGTKPGESQTASSLSVSTGSKTGSASQPSSQTSRNSSSSSPGNSTSNSSSAANTSSNTQNNTSSSTSSNNSSSASSNTSSTTSSNPGVTYLSVIDCVLTDKNCFVVVGKCEEGASVTAITAKQSVTVSSDKGFYSVRLEKLSEKTRVTLEAKGKYTEKYVYDAVPKVPTADMWPIVGGNGYNFFFQKMMPDFMQTNLLSDKMLEYLTQKTKDRVNNLKKALPDTEIIYMIVPSKASIYPELVPSEYKKGTGKSRLEQVNAALEAGGAKVINLLDVFSQHKNDQYKLYWNTDSHWTDYGAFVAYTELFGYIGTKFPAAAPRKMTEFDFKSDFYKSGDMMLYMMMNQSKALEYNSLRVPKFSLNPSITSVNRYRAANDLIYNDEVTYERVLTTNNSSLPNLYVIRDSYSTQMYDILAERGNTTFYKSMWNYMYDFSEIKRNAPDFIIYMVAEWNIDAVVNS
jgi:hypothetical protein